MANTIYSKEHSSLVDRLKKARLEAGLDQAAVAKLLKKSQSYISKIESGQRRVDVIQLKKFADIYKRNLNYFLNK
ncbi:MAG: helix-turn-helix transcriptional regulator [Candidatus Aminicenantes bacterium]|nr:helix-turn-helix transcriptional regulator [Candidatus Aminicenantes bacterium]